MITHIPKSITIAGLKRMRKILSTREAWCKGKYIKLRPGCEAPIETNVANLAYHRWTLRNLDKVQCCMMGAAYVSSNKQRRYSTVNLMAEMTTAIREANRGAFKERSIAQMNDRKSTKHENVLRWIDNTIIMLEGVKKETK